MEKKATYCKLCRKQLTSIVQMREHLQSKPHRERMDAVKQRQRGGRNQFSKGGKQPLTEGRRNSRSQNDVRQWCWGGYAISSRVEVFVFYLLSRSNTLLITNLVVPVCDVIGNMSFLNSAPIAESPYLIWKVTAPRIFIDRLENLDSSRAPLSMNPRYCSIAPSSLKTWNVLLK